MTLKHNVVRFLFAVLLPCAVYISVIVGIGIVDIGEYNAGFNGVLDSINYTLPFDELQEEIRDKCTTTNHPSWCRRDIKNSREYRATFGIP